MANAKRTVKPKRSKAQLVVCPECGHALDPRTAAPAKRQSIRQIFKDSVLTALDRGPASPREIAERLGVKPQGSDLATILRILERKGEVAIVGQRRAVTAHGNITFLWARVIKPSATNSAEPPTQAQAVEQISTGHNISPRGARS